MLVQTYYCDGCIEKISVDNIEEHTVKIGVKPYHYCETCFDRLKSYIETGIKVQDKCIQDETTALTNKSRTYHRFTEEEKKNIIRYAEEGKSVSWIARKLNRNFSSVQNIINASKSKEEEFEQARVETDINDRKAFVDSNNLNEVLSTQKSEDSAVSTADVQKRICHLVKWQGKSIAEVAEIMHVTMGDVKKALNQYL